MQAMLMSKQVNHVNSDLKFCMETGLPPGKYTEVFNHFSPCKTDIFIATILYMHDFVHYITVQELVIKK